MAEDVGCDLWRSLCSLSKAIHGESRMDDGRVPIVSTAGLYCSGVSALCWGLSKLKSLEAARIEGAPPITSRSGAAPPPPPPAGSAIGTLP